MARLAHGVRLGGVADNVTLVANAVSNERRSFLIGRYVENQGGNYLVTDGRRLEKQLDYPKGDPRNPLSDLEIEEKFDALAGPVLSPAARGKVKDAVWNLETLGSVTELMAKLKA